MTTLLKIVQDAAGEIGLEQPTVVVGATDPDIVKLLLMSNRHGRDLAKENWTVLQTLHTFTTTASTEEYALPSDYDRLIPNTEWDRTDYSPLIGPLSPQDWQTIKSGLIGSGVVDRRYRIVKSASSNGRTIRIDPTPSTSGDTLAFEYISKNWCESSGGTGQDEWAADDDVNLLDDDLMRLGLVLRYKRSVGLEYASEAAEYGDILSRQRAQDRPAPNLSIIPRMPLRLLGNGTLPETGWGS